MSADRFDTDVLSHAFIMLALADDLLDFVSSFLLVSVSQHTHINTLVYIIFGVE